MILYHGGCNDGFAAAYVAALATGDMDLYPCSYHKPLPDVTGKNVIMLDFGPDSYDDLLRLVQDSKSFLWIDHHVSQQEKAKEIQSNPKVDVYFDTRFSGAKLTLEYYMERGKFFPSAALQEIVAYIQDRDLWQHKLPDTHAITKYISTIPHTLADWATLNSLWTTNKSMYVSIGNALLGKDQSTVLRLVKNVREYVAPNGRKIGVVNSPVLQSEVGEYLYNNGYDLAVVWFQSDTQYVYSLRSTKLPCNKIAEDFGGGGHKNAAGFNRQLKIKFEDLCSYLV